MPKPRRDTNEAVVEQLAKARERQGQHTQETAERTAARHIALDSLGRDCRREERRKRIGWSLGAAALLALVVSVVTSPRTSSPSTLGREALAAAVELPSFPRDPFSAAFAGASTPIESFGYSARGPLRSTATVGPRIVAPRGSITERRPDVRFDAGELPDAATDALSVSLLHTLGHEVTADVTDRGELYHARLNEDLVNGEWIATVRLDNPDMDWSDRVRFVVYSDAHVEALLQALEKTGDAELDRLIEAAALIDAGFAELAQDKLRQATLIGDRMRARAVLLEARAARILGHDARVEELRAEWQRLRLSTDEASARVRTQQRESLQCC